MSKGTLLVADKGGVHVLKFVGDVRLTLGPAIETYLANLLAQPGFRSLVVDLTETEGIDSTSLGLLAKIAFRTQDKFDVVPTIVSTNDDVTRILLSMGFDDVFLIVREPLGRSNLNEMQLGSFEVGECSEDMLRDQVLEAHKVLMGMNDANRECFSNLVSALEEERGTARPSHGQALSR